MAARAKAAEDIQEEVNDGIQEEEKDDTSKDEKVTVFIPKDPLNKNEDSLYVAVNGENCRIKKGESVSVDKKFAEVIQRSQKIASEADETAKQLVSESNSNEPT